jgi:hypothetical protein
MRPYYQPRIFLSSGLLKKRAFFCKKLSVSHRLHRFPQIFFGFVRGLCGLAGRWRVVGGWIKGPQITQIAPNGDADYAWHDKCNPR